MKRYSVLHRLLSVVLCFVMVVSLFPVSVFAEGEELEPVEQTEPAPQVESAQVEAEPETIETVDVTVAFRFEDKTDAAAAFVLAVDKGAELAQIIPFAVVEGFVPAAAAIYDSEGLALDDDSAVSVELMDDGALLSGVLEQDVTVVVTYAAAEPVIELPVAEPADDNDVAVINAVPVEAVATYKFVAGETVVAELKAVNNGTVTVPAAPSVSGKAFLGWQLDDSTVLPGDVITANNILVSATFTYTAVYADIVTVTFMDEEGGIVYHTVSVAKGTAISQTDIDLASAKFEQDIEAAMKLDGWLLDGAAFTAGTTVDGSVTVVANVVEGQFVSFDSMGGTSVPRAEIGADGRIAKPADPTRTGYTFAGWYTDEDLRNEYNFSGKAVPGATLYAKWNGNRVMYTVIYWVENANYQNPHPNSEQDSEQYSYLASERSYGTAGTDMALADLNAKKSEIANKNYGDPAGFKNGRMDDGVSRTIAGDGSSIFNVYYDRYEYTITFEKAYCGKEEHTHQDKCVKQDWWTGKDYFACGMTEHTHTTAKCGLTVVKTVTAKYGADIHGEWPGGVWQVKSTDFWQASIYAMPLNGGSFIDGQTEGEGDTANYYLEVLPGDKYDQLFQEKYFALSHRDTAYGMTGLTVSDEDKYPIPGFTFWKLYAYYKNDVPLYDDADFFYTRNEYTVTYQLIGGAKGTSAYLYQQQITAKEVPAGYDGWFLDEQCTKSADTVLNGTMPAKNIFVYAKPHVEAYKVTVYVGTDANASPIGSYSEGTMLTRERLENDARANGVELPDADNFRGWYIKNADGSFTAYDFSKPLTHDIELCALRKSDLGRVTYLDAAGNTLENMDSASYVLGAQATAMAPAKSVSGFVGWQIVGTEKVIKPGETFAVTGNIVLQVVVSESETKQVTLKYDANGGVLAGTVENPVTRAEYSAVTLPTEKDVTREGYIFLGWAKSANAETPDFLPGEDVMLVEGDPDTLYAVWVKEQETSYTVKHVVGGVEQTADTRTYYGKAPVTQTSPMIAIVEGSLAQNSYTGYKFESMVNATAETTEVKSGTVITLNYVKDDSQTKTLSYTVEYYKDNVKVGADSYTKTASVWVNAPDTIAIQEAIDANIYKYAGYKLGSTEPRTLPVVGEHVADGTVITLNYVKRTDLSYTVHYVDKSTNEKVANPKTVEDQTFGATVNESAIEIEGYVAVGETDASLVIGVENNEITFYYMVDVKGGDNDGEETGDGIPDAYQAFINYVAEANGSVSRAREVVSFEDENGSGPAEGATATAAEGYKFVNWTKDGVEVSTNATLTGMTVNAGSEYTYTAHFTARDDTRYTVEHYKEQLDGSYKYVETDELTGTTDTLTNATAKSYLGFTAKKIEQQLIKGDGSTVVRVEYTRNSYKVRFEYEGDVPPGAPEQPADEDVKFEDKIEIPEITPPPGYNFEWDESPEDMPADDVTVTGRFTPRTDLSYTVNYLNADTGAAVAPSKTVNNQTFGTQVTENAVVVNGFNLPGDQTITIGVEDNVINFYYTAIPAIPGAPVVDLPAIPTLPETIDDEETPLAGPAVTVDDPMEIEDEATPLASLHECCILHFIILCVALVILLLYVYDVKKRQEKVFELREEIGR